MELHVDDDAFVRAPTPGTYRRLTDVAGWTQWWPGLRVRQVAEEPETWALGFRDGLLRIDVVAVPRSWRLDTGFVMDLTGDLEGTAEFWLESGWGGTVVHHVATATTPRRRPLRLLRGYRRSLRRGLWGFKDLMQAEERQAAGLAP